MDLNPGKANTESINWDVEFRKKTFQYMGSVIMHEIW